jgi:hypothetical protein
MTNHHVWLQATKHVGSQQQESSSTVDADRCRTLLHVDALGLGLKLVLLTDLKREAPDQMTTFCHGKA